MCFDAFYFANALLCFACSPAPMNAKRKRKPPLEEIENIENYEGTLQIDEGDLSIEEKRKEDSFTDSFNEYAKE